MIPIMQRIPPSRPAEDGDGQANRVTASLGGLAFLLVLVIAGLVLMRVLRDQGKLEDCLMSGRINCAPIATTIPPRY